VIETENGAKRAEKIRWTIHSGERELSWRK